MAGLAMAPNWLAKKEIEQMTAVYGHLNTKEATLYVAVVDL